MCFNRYGLLIFEYFCILKGINKGTKFTLDYAKEKNKPIKIIQI